MSENALRAAVVGAGPSGFYATDQLLKAGFEVDLLEVLPTPFGLVRAGVAPDHPKIKSVTRVYEKTAKHPGFRFYGGVELGGHVGRQDLLDRYHVVLYAVGTAVDNRLGIPGEDRPGSHGGARVRGLVQRPPGLRRPRVRPQRHARGRDRQRQRRGRRRPHARARSRRGRGHRHRRPRRRRRWPPPQVHEVIVLGRRGPAQAAFTTPELRELGELTRADIVVDPADMELDEFSANWLETEGDPTNKRNVELMREYAQREPHGHERRVELRFLRSPVEILGEGEDGPVTGIRDRQEPDRERPRRRRPARRRSSPAAS